jgi:DNA modification methylase
MELNKVYLGDAYKLIKELPDKSVDCIYTDVPYLIVKGGQGKSKLGKRIYKRNQELKDADIYNGFDYKNIIKEYIRVSKQINIFIWLSKSQILNVLNEFHIYDKNILFDILVWNKQNPVPSTNNIWLPDLEYAVHFREKGVRLNDGYNLKSKWYQSPINKSDKDLYDHPTIKPLELVKRHILHITQEKDIVLDTFLGSGTTAVACKETNRNYIGYENNEEYFKIAVDRLNNITQVERRMKDNGVLNIFDFLGDE